MQVVSVESLLARVNAVDMSDLLAANHELQKIIDDSLSLDDEAMESDAYGALAQALIGKGRNLFDATESALSVKH